MAEGSARAAEPAAAGPGAGADDGAPLIVAAIVVNWRQPDLTSAAVESLEQQVRAGFGGSRASSGASRASDVPDAPGVPGKPGVSGVPGDPSGSIELRIVIVDNGSGDGSAQVLAERHPGHTVVAVGTNGGFGAGVNAGIRAVDADVYVLLNNDAVADPGFVGSLVAPLRSDPGVAAVTARIVLRDRYRVAAAVDGRGEGDRDGDGPGVQDALVAADGTRWVADAAGVELLNSTGNESTRSGNGRDRDWLRPVDEDHRGGGEVMAFSGGASALRATALERVGLFDESLFMYYEDTDLSWRLRRDGWSIRYEPSASVRHAHAASTGTGSDTFRFYNERNRILVAAKNAPAGVVLTALARTAVGTARALASAVTARTPATRAEARRRLRSLGAALRRLPSALAARRRLDRTARVPRALVAAFLVRD